MNRRVSTTAERRLQLRFSKSALAPMLLLAALGVGWSLIAKLPDRYPQPDRSTIIAFDPVALDSSGFAGTQLAGAWRLTSPDRRLGGLSALAVDRGGFVALTDSGVVIRFGLPRRGGLALARIADLPGGPGSPAGKKNRDSEALDRDPGGGWLVAFEYAHQLWRFDSTFARVTGSRALPGGRWPANRGIEGIVAARDGTLLLLAEDGRSLVRLSDRRMTIAPIAGAGPWAVADAALLPDGRLLVLRRRITAGGLRSSLAELAATGGTYRHRRELALGFGPLDNPEGMAAQRLPGGRIRLWLVTDDDFRWPMRTLLVALDLPASRQR